MARTSRSIEETPESRMATKNAISELYVHWASTPSVMESLDLYVKDLLAAARHPRGEALSRHIDPAESDGSNTPPTHYGRSPSPPGSPPITRVPSNGPRVERSPVSTRNMIRVDEMDTRSPSAGSSQLGTLSSLSEASGLANISPTPPPELATSHHHIPQHHLSGRLSASSMSGLQGESSGYREPATTSAATSDIPTFYTKSVIDGRIDEAPADELWALKQSFASRQKGSIDLARTIKQEKFVDICKQVFGLPGWLSDLLFWRIVRYCNLPEGTTALGYTDTARYYEEVMAYSTPNRRLFDLIKEDPDRNYCTQDDFKAAVKLLVDHHPGLDFLRQPEFQDFYCRTVAIRIIYELDLRQDRRVTWHQFDRSDLPTVMFDLDQTTDINQILRFFSYEHFYVLYCRFWELDVDRDQNLELSDLMRYSNGSITTRVLQRVVEGAGRRLTQGVGSGKLDFEDFVYFCLAEEDKNSPAAVFYWFKVLDLDGDGVLSGFELGYFLEEQRAKFAEVNLEDVKIEDMLCQMLDMLGATRVKNHPLGLTLADVRSCPTPANFFNMIFNATKFSRFEHKDPFNEHQMRQQPEKTDWDRFARQEYDRMASEVAV